MSSLFQTTKRNGPNLPDDQGNDFRIRKQNAQIHRCHRPMRLKGMYRCHRPMRLKGMSQTDVSQRYVTDRCVSKVCHRPMRLKGMLSTDTQISHYLRIVHYLWKGSESGVDHLFWRLNKRGHPQFHLWVRQIMSQKPLFVWVIFVIPSYDMRMLCSFLIWLK